MNKVPGAVGLGLGLALSSGLFNPAEAHETPIAEEVHCHTGFMFVGLGGVVEAPECNSVSESYPMVSPAKEELNSGLQNDSSDFFSALGFLVAGLAGVAVIGYGTKKYVTYRVDAIQADLYPVKSEPLPSDREVERITTVNHEQATLDRETLVRNLHDMQKAEPIVVDAEWIVSQASRSNEQ